MRASKEVFSLNRSGIDGTQRSKGATNDTVYDQSFKPVKDILNDVGKEVLNLEEFK